MSNLIDQLRVMKGKAHKQIAQLGRSLHKRRRDILAFFDRGVSNGPVEAINGRLEHLRGIALGFKKPQPLHLAMPHPLRRPYQQNQRTLKPEEPIKLVQLFGVELAVYKVSEHMSALSPHGGFYSSSPGIPV